MRSRLARGRLTIAKRPTVRGDGAELDCRSGCVKRRSCTHLPNCDGKSGHWGLVRRDSDTFRGGGQANMKDLGWRRGRRHGWRGRRIGRDRYSVEISLGASLSGHGSHKSVPAGRHGQGHIGTVAGFNSSVRARKRDRFIMLGFSNWKACEVRNRPLKAGSAGHEDVKAVWAYRDRPRRRDRRVRKRYDHARNGPRRW